MVVVVVFLCGVKDTGKTFINLSNSGLLSYSSLVPLHVDVLSLLVRHKNNCHFKIRTIVIRTIKSYTLKKKLNIKRENGIALTVLVVDIFLAVRLAPSPSTVTCHRLQGHLAETLRCKAAVSTGRSRYQKLQNTNISLVLIEKRCEKVESTMIVSHRF